MNKALTVILAAVLIDAIGIGLIFPILPDLLRDVGHVADPSVLLGVMLALYSACQFLCAPVLGVLSDKFGRRPVLLMSLAGAAIDYVLMAFAPHIALLVVGRAIAGITAANMAVATAYITDISTEEERAKRFGMFHAMFGVGFVVGPILGGLLGDYWVRAPFILAALLNGLNFALAFFVLPESRPGNADTRFSASALNPFRPLRWAMTFKPLIPLMALFVILNFVGTMYGTVWALFTQDSFRWNGLMIGLSLGAYGVFHAIAQAFLTGPAVLRLGERGALLTGMACEVVSLLLLSVATHGWVVFALTPLFALGGIGMPALQSFTTMQVDADRQGQLQGVLSSLVSLAAVLGPLFFSMVYFSGRTAWPGVVWAAGAAIYLLAIPLMLGVRRLPSAGQMVADHDQRVR